MEQTTFATFRNSCWFLTFVSNNTCSLDLHSGDVQITTVLFTRNFPQGWLNFYHSFLLCFAFLYANVFRLIKVLEMKRSGFRLLEDSFATTLLVVCCVYNAAAVAYLSIPFVIMLVVVVGLLRTSSMYSLVCICCSVLFFFNFLPSTLDLKNVAYCCH